MQKVSDSGPGRRACISKLNVGNELLTRLDVCRNGLGYELGIQRPATASRANDNRQRLGCRRSRVVRHPHCEVGRSRGVAFLK